MSEIRQRRHYLCPIVRPCSSSCLWINNYRFRVEFMLNLRSTCLPISLHHGNCVWPVYIAPSPEHPSQSFRMKNTIDTTQRVSPTRNTTRTRNSMATRNWRKWNTHTKFTFIFLHDDWVSLWYTFAWINFHQNKEEKLLRLMSQWAILYAFTMAKHRRRAWKFTTDCENWCSSVGP